MWMGPIESVKGLKRTKWSAFLSRRECLNRRSLDFVCNMSYLGPRLLVIGRELHYWLSWVFSVPAHTLLFHFWPVWEYNMHLASHTPTGVEVRCMQAPEPLPAKVEERKVSLAASCVFLVWVTMPWQASSMWRPAWANFTEPISAPPTSQALAVLMLPHKKVSEPRHQGLDTSLLWEHLETKWRSPVTWDKKRSHKLCADATVCGKKMRKKLTKRSSFPVSALMCAHHHCSQKPADFHLQPP